MWYFEKIPKIVHFYWSGAPLSYIRYFTVYSFKQLNPDWKIYMHTEKDLTSTNKIFWRTPEQKEFYSGKDYSAKALDLADEIMYHDFSGTKVSGLHGSTKSDYLRWQLLHKYGGLWSDLDILYVQSMECLPENIEANKHIEDCVIIKGVCYSIGFLLSMPDSHFYGEMVRKAETTPLVGYQSLGSPMIKEVDKRFHKDPKPLKLNWKSVYPLDYAELYQYTTSNPSFIKDPDIIGYHWYAGGKASLPFYESFENNSYEKTTPLGYARNRFET